MIDNKVFYGSCLDEKGDITYFRFDFRDNSVMRSSKQTIIEELTWQMPEGLARNYANDYDSQRLICTKFGSIDLRDFIDRVSERIISPHPLRDREHCRLMRAARKYSENLNLALGSFERDKELARGMKLDTEAAKAHLAS